jgi:Uma2 family endonuclease
MRTTTVERYRWTRQEFEQLASMGFFDPEERLELIDGAIFHMPVQSSFHATAVYKAGELLRDIYQKGYLIRVQMPLAIDEYSLPEPDIAVVRGSWRDYRENHPATALLVVEVADSSLQHDKNRKRPRYDQAGITEYWILNLTEYCLEVYRDPVGSDYQSHLRLTTITSAPCHHCGRSATVAPCYATTY